MKVVVISRCSPSEWIVVQEIIKNFDEVYIIKTTSSPKPNQFTGFGAWINGFGNRVLNKIQKILLEKRLTPKFYKNLKFDILKIPSVEINELMGKKLLASFAPDIILTCYAPILDEAVIKIPTKASINVHYGISPEYRGTHTLFWPVLNKDYQHIGGTIHYITKGVDTGNILAKTYPALNPSDNEVDIMAKTAELLAQAVVVVLKKMELNGPLPPGKTQNGRGRNYKRVERTFWLSLKMLALRRIGLYKPKASPKKVEFFI